MKKTLKKLVLAKDTVRNLEQRELGQAAGQASLAGTCTVCCSGYPGCGTTQCGPTETGTTKYC